MERLSPSFHCPWLSVVAVLVVVGSIPPGDFFVFFWAKLLFWGHSAVRLGIWVDSKKRSWRIPS